MFVPWKKSYDHHRQCIKKQRHYFAHKGPSSQSYGFSSSHVWMWELNHKESWATKNWCFELWCWRRLFAARKGSILKKISPGYSHWKDWCKELTHWKRSWCWERLKAGGEGDNRGWDGWMASPTQWTEFEQIPRVGDGQGGLACCSPWGLKESDTTEWRVALVTWWTSQVGEW